MTIGLITLALQLASISANFLTSNLCCAKLFFHWHNNNKEGSWFDYMVDCYFIIVFTIKFIIDLTNLNFKI